MKVEDIKKVLIIGAGAMGQQIGFQCAIHGFEIALYDVAQGALDKALTHLEKLAGSFVAAGKLSQADVNRALDRVEICTDAARAADNADLVSESVPEDPDLKARVFAQFNALCPERTVFTTNTSSLLPSMFAEATGVEDHGREAVEPGLVLWLGELAAPDTGRHADRVLLEVGRLQVDADVV